MKSVELTTQGAALAGGVLFQVLVQQHPRCPDVSNRSMSQNTAHILTSWKLFCSNYLICFPDDHKENNGSKSFTLHCNLTRVTGRHSNLPDDVSLQSSRT